MVLVHVVVARDQLDFIINPYYLAASLGLDVLLGDVFGLVVEQAMRIPRPSHASHVHFVFRFDCWILCG